MVSKVASILVVLLALSTLAWSAEVPDSIKGTWKINHDESMELMKTSRKYDESEKDMLSRSIAKREPVMVLEVTRTSIELVVGKRSQMVRFTVDSATDSEVHTTAKVKDKEFALDFKLIKGKYLQMISSASDDMNYFAWERK